MNLEHYFPFIIIVFVLLISPGPSVLLSINNGINYGKKVAAIGVIGNVIAFQILILLSATGISVLLIANSQMLSAMKLIGAAYLCYLGVKAFIATPKSNSVEDMAADENISKQSVFKQALWVTLTNPKALIFVSALLPQFLKNSEKLSGQIIILCAISAVIHFTIYYSYAALADKARSLISSTKNKRRVNIITGITFVSFGVSLALTNLSFV